MPESVPDAMRVPAGDPDIDSTTLLLALRERGADRFDPVRFRFMEALARRAAAHRGEARRIVEDTLAKTLTEYRNRVEHAPDRAASPRAQSHSHRSPLADLLGHIAQHAATDMESDQAPDARMDSGAPAELKSLRYFRGAWAKLSADQQLTQALAQAPENAGPLNSHLLVLESLTLMRDLSPDYLNRFMSYVDALLWLDQAGGGSTSRQPAVVRGESEKKRKTGRAKSG